ncbi:MAG: immunoglobulin-like domain-containing protein [Clostridia bacterium]
MKHGKKNNVKRKNMIKKVMIVALALVLLSTLGIFGAKTISENTAKPEIHLIGAEEISLNLGETYEEQGAEAKLNEDKLTPEIMGEVDTNIPGEYIIKYTVANKKGKNETTVERRVLVKDNIAPTIELKGEDTIKLFVGDKYEEKGASANDNIDGDLTSNIEIIGSVDTSKPENYEIEYKIKDSAGNQATAKRKVIVSEKKKIATTSSKSGLPVLMYHFFYDKNVSSGKDNNYMEISDFENQIKYLTDNNFYFPTWQEVEDYIDGKISLPDKSVVITVDDGDDSFFELAVPIIQKYNAKATSFVITSWYGYRANNKQVNISYQSHSDCMHEGANGKGVMLSWSYDKILEDVKQSSQTLGGSTVFCYPFGHYNDLDKKVLKDAGYRLAFTTEGGRVYKGSDKFALPRVRMSKGVSLSTFASMVQ